MDLIEYTINGISYGVQEEQHTDGLYMFAIDYDNLATGQYPLLVEATDAAGNLRSATLTLQIIKDAPQIMIDPYPTIINSDTTITGRIIFPYPQFAGYHSGVFYVDGTELLNGRFTVNSTENTFAARIDVSDFLAGGTYPISIEITDELGTPEALAIPLA